jgi:hypothetical protein
MGNPFAHAQWKSNGIARLNAYMGAFIPYPCFPGARREKRII